MAIEAVIIRASNPRFKTTTAPVDGAANKAVIKMLSEALDCPKSSLRIKSGETSRDKVFVIEGVGQEELRRRIRQIEPAKVVK